VSHQQASEAPVDNDFETHHSEADDDVDELLDDTAKGAQNAGNGRLAQADAGFDDRAVLTRKRRRMIQSRMLPILTRWRPLRQSRSRGSLMNQETSRAIGGSDTHSLGHWRSSLFL
jgi:hypothetical protein